jgi:hypothetical protein
LFALFAILLTLFLIYQLNPDKEALPWRSYCALQPAFPPDNFYTLTPAGVFIGVFSMDSGLERRMFVRQTFANHERSRVDNGTSRTIVRFILGKPRPEWERRIQLEAEGEFHSIFRVIDNRPRAFGPIRVLKRVAWLERFPWRIIRNVRHVLIHIIFFRSF